MLIAAAATTVDFRQLKVGAVCQNSKGPIHAGRYCSNRHGRPGSPCCLPYNAALFRIAPGAENSVAANARRIHEGQQNVRTRGAAASCDARSYPSRLYKRYGSKRPYGSSLHAYAVAVD